MNAFLTDLQFHPVTPERWADLETLFGKSGAYGGCWCMWWRASCSAFEKQGNSGNRQALKDIVDSGEVPGLLAYVDGQPVGWCSVAPREAYPSLERSRTLKRVDDLPVWSVVCFYVARPYRHKGFMARLLEAAIEYAKEHGAKIVEGYPVEPKNSNLPPVSSFTGIVSVFQEVGFVEVMRRSERRPIMRYFIEDEHEPEQTHCFICHKHRGEIAVPGGVLYEDDLLYASHIGQMPLQEGQSIYLGYLMIESRRHVPGLADLTNEEAQATGLMVTRLSRALKACTTAEHIYEFVLGDHVPHLHIHLVPRYPGAPREYWGTHVDEWPGAPHGGTQEIEALCGQIRAYLESEP